MVYKQVLNPRTGKFNLVLIPDGDAMSTDGSNYVGDLPLTIPTLEYTWDSSPSTITQQAPKVTVEKGTIVSLNCKYKWTASDTKKAPTSVSGDFTILTASGVWSEPLILNNITSDRTISVKFHAPKAGLITASDGRVIKATGSTAIMYSISVSFAHRQYIGVGTSFDSSNIDSLLSNTRARTLSNITTAANEYFYIAYPKELGALTSIIQNGATPILGAFTRTEVTINNAGGTPVTYYLYTLNNVGSLTGTNTLKLI